MARLISPEAYGALAVALTAVSFARWIGDLGVQNSLLPQPTIDAATLRAGALIALSSAACLAACLMVVAPALATVLHGPADTATIIRVLAVSIVVEAFRFAPNVRLNRALHFGALGAASLAETMVLYVVQIALLLADFGVWALVIAQVARSVGGTLILGRLAGWAIPGRGGGVRALLKRALPYQGPAILAGLTGLLFPLAVATALGARGVGFWAWSTVLTTPISAVVAIISGVTLPALARLREGDAEIVDRAAALMLRAAVLVPASAAGLLVGFSDPVVAYVFGPRWNPAEGAVVFNLIGVVPMTFAYFLAAVLESNRRPGIRLVAGLVANVAGLGLILPLAVAWGPTGAALVTGVIVPVVDAMILGWWSRLGLWRSVGDGIVAAVACGVIAFTLAQFVGSLPALLLCLLAALPATVAVAFYTDRTAVRRFLEFGFPLPAKVGAILGVRSEAPS